MSLELLEKVPKRVRVVEVGPRDGLQNEAVILSTDDKVRLVELLAASGLADIEVSSFVSPKRVPQLADASEVFTRLKAARDVRYWALVPNRVGLQRALAAGVRAIAVFTAASETFTQRNIGMSITDSLKTFTQIVPEARAAGVRVRAYVSTAFVCPYEGTISPEQVLPVVSALQEMKVDDVSIGDTIGHATPDGVARLTEALAPVLPRNITAYHFHDTQGLALANTLMALQYGIAIYDSAVGGVGGCPFAPGAAGNLATEELLALLHGMGIETGVNRDHILTAARFLQEKLGHPLTLRY